MIRQRIQRGIAGCQNFDLELVVERARQELWSPQLVRNGVEVHVGILCAEPFGKSKKFLECVVQPHARRSAAKQEVILSKNPPYSSRILHLRNAELQFFQRDPLA